TASPAAIPWYTIEFIDKYRALQQAGFSIDDLNYLLSNQSAATPSLVPDTTAVIDGLTGFRTAIQAAVALSTPVLDPKGTLLKKWLADPDLHWDTTISSGLLNILNAVGTTSSLAPASGYTALVQSNLRFLQLLQTHYGASSVTSWLDGMPALSS